MHKLVTFLRMQDAGCPITRHELTNDEWLWLGVLRAEEKVFRGNAGGGG